MESLKNHHVKDKAKKEEFNMSDTITRKKGMAYLKRGIYDGTHEFRYC